MARAGHLANSGLAEAFAGLVAESLANEFVFEVENSQPG